MANMRGTCDLLHRAIGQVENTGGGAARSRGAARSIVERAVKDAKANIVKMENKLQV
jgi:hypothetical protein